MSQADVAKHQLEKSVSLFVDEKNYICNITLSAAADGIYSGFLKKRNIQSAFEEHKKVLKEKGNAHLTDKELNDMHLNLVRNALKHAAYEEHEEKYYALETEAIYYLTRAIDNHIRLGYILSENLSRFVHWVNKNRPDLTDPDAEVEIIRPYQAAQH